MKHNPVRMWQDFRASEVYDDRISRVSNGTKQLILKLFRIILIVGISYIILSPVIGIVTSSFFSDSDRYNPIVFTIPMNPVL